MELSCWQRPSPPAWCSYPAGDFALRQRWTGTRLRRPSGRVRITPQLRRSIRREFQQSRGAELRRASTSGTPSERVPPASLDEARLAAIWEEVLHVSPVGVTDAFLSLGGQSLQAAGVVSRIAAEFAVRIPLACFSPIQRLRNYCVLSAPLPGSATLACRKQGRCRFPRRSSGSGSRKRSSSQTARHTTSRWEKGFAGRLTRSF